MTVLLSLFAILNPFQWYIEYSRPVIACQMLCIKKWMFSKDIGMTCGFGRVRSPVAPCFGFLSRTFDNESGVVVSLGLEHVHV